MTRALLRTGLRPFFGVLGMFENMPHAMLKKNDPLWPPLWATLLILIFQAVVYEVCAYLKDRMATRPLGHAPSRFSQKRRDRLDAACAAERGRVLALVDAEDSGDVALVEDVEPP